MIDPLDFEKRPLINRINRLRFWTALVIFAERAVNKLWRPVIWSLFFAGLCLWNIPSAVGSVISTILLLTFIGGLIALSRDAFKSLRWPSRKECLKRMEQDNHLLHAPIQSLEDTLANPQKSETRYLWEQTKEKAFGLIRSLKHSWPCMNLAQSDIYALRFLALLVFLTGFIAAGPLWSQRLQSGLIPLSFSLQTEKDSKYTIWITPPEYTALNQIILQEHTAFPDTLAIPQDSLIKIRLAGGWGAPVYHIQGKDLPLEPLNENNWSLETTIKEDSAFKVTQWPMTNIKVPFQYLTDKPPQITLLDVPETIEGGALRPRISVEDDYGITDLSFKMSLAPNVEASPLGAPYMETRALMSAPQTPMELSPVYDLAWHPWAGLPVVLELEVFDYLGQNAALAPIHMTLPEKTFTHPVAAKLIEMRKRLIWTPDAAARNIAYELTELLYAPSAFQDDPLVFLAIKVAAMRMLYNPDTKDVVSVIELLWDTAIRIEDGNLPLAARSLREARENLEAVLNDPNASDTQIAMAIQELQQALAEYFQELMRELQKRMAENGHTMQMPPQAFQNLITPEDVESFLNQLQSEALSGDKDKARELLSQLQQFMDNLNSSMDMTMPPQMQFMAEGINELQELIDKQQALLDQTQEHIEDNDLKMPQTFGEFLPFEDEILKKWNFGTLPPPPTRNQDRLKEPAINTQSNKTEQDALRYVLGQLMLDADEQLGKIPEKMQLAEREMRRSSTALGQNNPLLSVPHQEKAITYLQDAMQDMSEQMQQMMQQMAMMALGSMNLDPLGRPLQEGDGQSNFPGSTVKIPDESQRKKVQEILKELRARSGEYDRPDYELEYYRRLLKQF